MRALPSREPVASSTNPDLPALFRAFAALGSGLCFFALSADGLLTAAESGGPVEAGSGVAAGIWAVAQTVWGLLALHGGDSGRRFGVTVLRGTPSVLPAAAAVVLGALVWTALLAPEGSRRLDLTLVSALVLMLLQLGAHGVLRRRGRASRQIAPARMLAGMFGCAVLVAAITTPGLAASTAGDFAVPHGQHGLSPDGHDAHG